MLSADWKLSEQSSAMLNLVKILLVVQVVGGHLMALLAPKMQMLDLSMKSDIVLAALKASTSFGREAAFMFVCLSGFLTAKSIYAADKSWILPMFNRLKRLYPTLLAGLALTIVLDAIGIYWLDLPFYRSNEMGFDAVSQFNFSLFLANIFSLQPVFSLTFGSNGPLWTIGYLIQFYLLSQLIKPIYHFGVLIGGLAWILFATGYYYVAGFEPVLLLTGWLACSGLRFIVSSKPVNCISLPAWPCFALVMVFFLAARFSSVNQSIILISIASLAFSYALLFARNMPGNNTLCSFSKKIVDDLFIVYVSHMPIIFIALGVLSSYVFENVLAKVLISASLCVLLILCSTPIIRSVSRVLENVATRIVSGKLNG